MPITCKVPNVLAALTVKPDPKANVALPILILPLVGNEAGAVAVKVPAEMVVVPEYE